ncbi:MAG: hypothetical protein IPM56_18610 [Ignavibacteriales bacterium]|nr:MAG: hypothetical protein IPM56_18610 [Ignavibacteriales bacterium]
MNDKQENRFSMFDAVTTLLDANTAKTAAITNFAPALLEFKNLKAEIVINDGLKSTVTTGKAANKAAAESDLIDATMVIASAISALGASTGNNFLKELGDVNKTKLVRMRDTQLAAYCTTMHTEANSNAAALAGYGITQVMIDEYEEKKDLFAGSSGVRESSAATKVAATQAVVDRFVDADTLLLEQMDKMMEFFRTSDTMFYDEYHAARRVIDLGVRHEPEEPENPNP